MKTIIILGSTGSIGRQTLDVIRASKNKFKVVGLSANTNKSLLEKQAKEFGAKWITTENPAELASKKCDIVVNAISGLAGLEPTLAALKVGNKIALANKESIVASGEKIMRLAMSGQIVPVDSEHSSIYQCLVGRDINTVDKIILTCSGGPFLGKKKSELKNASASQALAHPTWSMGKKISVDSATLMNKGFEVIEAHHLFGIPYEKIEVLIHPQSIVHGMVVFKDGSIVAHASMPDMKIPIAYALGANVSFSKLDLAGKNLNFLQPDHETFEGIKIALKYKNRGKKLVEANDEAVHKFLAGEIEFLDIYKEIKKSLAR